MAGKQKKQLLRFFGDLDERRQQSLLEYAEFLFEQTEQKSRTMTEHTITPRVMTESTISAQSMTKPAITPAAMTEPTILPRPAGETVVGAIKRLSASYTMLDKHYMLHELSSLMGQHMLQGRETGEVINEIESVFKTQFQAFMKKQEQED